MTPYVPVLPDEIVSQVLEVAELGACMVHIHARETDSGIPTFKKDIYKRIIEGIRSENRGLILCVSTSGRIFSEYGQRSECLDIDGKVKPDFASLTLGSVNFNRHASINAPDTIHNLGGTTGVRLSY